MIFPKKGSRLSSEEKLIERVYEARFQSQPSPIYRVRGVLRFSYTSRFDCKARETESSWNLLI